MNEQYESPMTALPPLADTHPTSETPIQETAPPIEVAAPAAQPQEGGVVASSAPKPTPKFIFTGTDKILAWLCWFVGYLFWRIVTPGRTGVGVLACTVVFAAVQLWYYHRTNAPYTRGVWWVMLPIFFSLPFLLFSPGTLLVFDRMFLMVAIVMGIYFTYDTPRRDLSDPLRALFWRPFSHFGAWLGAVFCKNTDKKGNPRLGRALLGLCLALPVTVVVGALLIQADAAFSNLANKLFDPLFQSEVLLLLIPRLMIAVPVAFYLFGAIYGNAKKIGNDLSDESWARTRTSARLAHSTTLLWAGVPLCVVYVLFFVAQIPYYFSAFGGLLPDTFTYAEYARRGFFELCTVTVINLLMIMAVRLFCRREDEKLPNSIKSYTVVLCGFTLLLIATAMRKMVLYIENYGLTPLRVYTTWFMLLLAVVFVILAVTQFLPRVRSLRAVSVAFLILFAVLQFSNVNAGIAAYNVHAYQEGRLSKADVSLFYDLGDAAVPYAAELLDDGRFGSAVRSFLEDRQYQLNLNRPAAWYEFNFTSHRAWKVLTQLEQEGRISPNYADAF